MNKLDTAKRAKILSMLVEGSSMRSTARVMGVSFNTVAKLMIEAGKVCEAYHNDHVREVRANRVQCDEIWAFVGAKEKTASAKRLNDAGDVWTWTAVDADSKLVVSWLIGDRSGQSAIELMDDLRARLASRVQLTTDGHRAYAEAVEGAFGGDVDYAQLVKLYGQTGEEEQRRYSPARCIGTKKRSIIGNPAMADVNTSYVERHNLTMRMSMRRFTRLTNAFSKKVANHAYMVALYTVWYNWIRTHKTIKATPAMAAGLTDRQYTMEWIVGMIDEKAPKPGPRGAYKQLDADYSN